MQLTNENDKMKMIDIAINPINEFIKSFFNELKSNINLVDNDIGKNILNINGSWGSGKSTIVNNLEFYYQYENDNEKPNFFIFNLWKYETITNPYFKLVNDILNKILDNDQTISKKTKQYKLEKSMNTSWKIPFLSLIGAELKFNANMLKNYENDLNKLIDETVSKLKNILNKNNKQIVIIFDDLDRCTPNNQIIFLSYIKNIFLNITNIFFIVSSNNEVINQKLYTENKYELENYTDKLFNNSFDLDINFGSENLIFTENKFIKHFLKEMNITNPRLIDKIIENGMATLFRTIFW